MIFAAALFTLVVGSVSVKATVESGYGDEHATAPLLRGKSRALTAPDPNGAKIDRCILVNLKTMTEYILDTMTVTEYKFDEASPSGWSVKCFGETGKDIDFVKFFYDADFVSEQFYSPERFPEKPWEQPFWMAGDNRGDEVNDVPYLNSAGKKEFTVKFYTWEGGDTYPSDKKQYELNGGALSKCSGVVCPVNAVCDQATGACDCNAGLVLKDGACVPPANSTVVEASGDDYYDGLCGWNEHYNKCRKHYGSGSGLGCYDHYKHQCNGLSRRHLKAVENTRALAEDHGACMADQYNMFLVMKGAHMTGLATPVNDASACPNLVFHSNVPIEGDMTKAVMIVEEEGVAAIAESEKLHLGTQSLLSIVVAFDNADVSKKGEKAYDAVTNNCVVLLRNMADPLDIPVDQRMINFVSKRLLAESGEHVVGMMKQSPALSAIFGTGGRFLKGVGAEEIVAKVISLYV